MIEQAHRPVSAVEIVPLGSLLPPERAERIGARLSRELSVACRLARPAALPPAAIPGRDQLDADAILASLEAAPAEGVVRLGVTGHDLAIPVFTFVFGRARAGGAAAILSLARLDPAFYGLPPDEEELLRRTVREALHELAHVASLAHCSQALCLMRFAGSVEKADLRGARFCAECAARLPAWMRAAAR
jgi:archaemetzincin